MKNNHGKKTYAQTAILLGLLASGINAQAQSDGSFGGGRGILIDGAPELIDAYVNCEWNMVYDFGKKQPLFQKLMSALEEMHPVLALETKAEMMKIPMCKAKGGYLQRIDLSMGPDFFTMKSFEKGPQLAVRWFLDSTGYPDEVYLDSKEYARLPENQKAELLFHEVFHSFVPRDGSEGRDLKISSLGNSMLQLLAGTLTREQLEMQLVQARVVGFNTSVDPVVYQYRNEIQKLYSFNLEASEDNYVNKPAAILAWKAISNDFARILSNFSFNVSFDLKYATQYIIENAQNAILNNDMEKLASELDLGVPGADSRLLGEAIKSENAKAIITILNHPKTVLNPISKDAVLNQVVEIGLKNASTQIPVLKYLSDIKKVSEAVAILALTKNAPSVIQMISEKADTSIQIMNEIAKWVAKHPGALLDQTADLVLNSPKTLSELNGMGILLLRDAFTAKNESTFGKLITKVPNINRALDLQDNTLLIEMVRSGKLSLDPTQFQFLKTLLTRQDLDVNKSNAKGEVAFQIAVDQLNFRVACEISQHTSFDLAVIQKWLKDPKRSWEQNKKMLLAGVSEANVALTTVLAHAKYFSRLDWIEAKKLAEIKYPNRMDLLAIINGELQ